MLAHLLLGTSTLTHGGLKFSARCASTRGQAVSVQINSGPALAVTVTQKGLGAGSIIATVAAGAKEKQLIKALRADRKFNNICRVEQESGDGNAVVGVLAKTQLGAPEGGLLQWLDSQLALLGWGVWDDRDVTAIDKPSGYIFAFDTLPQTESYNRNECDRWKATFKVALAIQLNNDRFHEQNALLDLAREHIYYAVKTFEHPALIDQADDASDPAEVYGFKNELKPEAGDTTDDKAHLRVVGTFTILYEQAPYELTDLTSHDLKGYKVGIFRNPIDEPPGSENAELDAVINLEVE
jgi:hypothetical protein